MLHAFCAFVAFQALTTTTTPNDNYICAIPLTAPPEPIHIPVGVQTKSDYMNTELGQRVCKEYPIEARSLRFHLHIYSYIHLHTLTHTPLHPHTLTSKRICVQSLLYSLSSLLLTCLHRMYIVSLRSCKACTNHTVTVTLTYDIKQISFTEYRMLCSVYRKRCSCPQFIVAYLVSYIVCYIQPSMCVFQRERV